MKMFNLFPARRSSKALAEHSTSQLQPEEPSTLVIPSPCSACSTALQNADDQFGVSIRAAGAQFKIRMAPATTKLDRLRQAAEAQYSSACAVANATYHHDFCEARDLFNASAKLEVDHQTYSSAIRAVSFAFHAELAPHKQIRDSAIAAAMAEYRPLQEAAQQALSDDHTNAHHARDAVRLQICSHGSH